MGWDTAEYWPAGFSEALARSRRTFTLSSPGVSLGGKEKVLPHPSSQPWPPSSPLPHGFVHFLDCTLPTPSPSAPPLWARSPPSSVWTGFLPWLHFASQALDGKARRCPKRLRGFQVAKAPQLLPSLFKVEGKSWSPILSHAGPYSTAVLWSSQNPASLSCPCSNGFCFIFHI